MLQLYPLCRLVLTEGIPPETEDEKAKRDATNDPSVHDVCTLRGTIWKLLLGALHMDAVHYMHLIAEGPTWMDQKIRNDTFRTFQVRLIRSTNRTLASCRIYRNVC